ncbi:MAG TPA: dCTP deaminase [Acidobacteriota bacterium]|nr:dCTP deaminase [Acidobacteriota bacterium]
MGLKADHWIERMAREKAMIDPFQSSQVGASVISYGVSSYGYDFRLSRFFKRPPRGDEPLDPKAVAADDFIQEEGDSCLIEPASFLLARSLEYFRIPRDVLTLCTGKSTYARCGVVVNVTPFEPEWEGYATLSISNTGRRPVRIYAGEGIGQLVFLSAREPCRVSYADRKGKYQAQQDITTARVEDDS